MRVIASRAAGTNFGWRGDSFTTHPQVMGAPRGRRRARELAEVPRALHRQQDGDGRVIVRHNPQGDGLLNVRRPKMNKRTSVSSVGRLFISHSFLDSDTAGTVGDAVLLERAVPAPPVVPGRCDDAHRLPGTFRVVDEFADSPASVA